MKQANVLSTFFGEKFRDNIFFVSVSKTSFSKLNSNILAIQPFHFSCKLYECNYGLDLNSKKIFAQSQHLQLNNFDINVSSKTTDLI